ncbi:hypothetical protein ACLOJK_013436 [Asimina triloba]
MSRLGKREGIQNSWEATLALLPVRVLQAASLRVRESVKIYTKTEDEVIEEQVCAMSQCGITCKRPLERSEDEEDSIFKKRRHLEVQKGVVEVSPTNGLKKILIEVGDKEIEDALLLLAILPKVMGLLKTLVASKAAEPMSEVTRTRVSA